MKKSIELLTCLWEKLGDIPIDGDDCIEEPFEHFPVGTSRYEIWHWFEEQSPSFHVSKIL